MSYLPIKLDKTRNLSLGFEGLQLFKKITGTSLAKLDYDNAEIEDYIPAIFHCALIHEDKDLTLEDTTRLIDKHLGVSGALELFPQIMDETFGKEENEDEEGTKNAPRAAKKK